MDYDYEDSNDYENDYDEYDVWEVRIDNEPINTFDNKYDAIDSLLEEINILCNIETDEEKIEKILIEKYTDIDDLINELSCMCAVDFYEYITCVTEKLNINNYIRLINLDNNEPDFGEL